MTAPDTELVSTDTDARFWTKNQLAEWLGVKVSYVEGKARSREWPSYMFSELRFSPEQVAEILAMHERKAQGAADVAADLITVAQAAKKIGISRPTAYRMVAAKELPVVDVAREGSRRPKLRVPVAAIRDLIEQRALDAA